MRKFKKKVCKQPAAEENHFLREVPRKGALAMKSALHVLGAGTRHGPLFENSGTAVVNRFSAVFRGTETKR